MQTDREPERSGSLARSGNISEENGVAPAPRMTAAPQSCGLPGPFQSRGLSMNNIIYIVGLIVVVLAILSFLGLR